MQTSFFDLENRYADLSKAGDPLERLNATIDWEIFRPILNRLDPTQRKSASGRPPTCRILLFKMLVLQRLYNLSDERLEYQVTDRLSFMRFLGLELAGDVPDARTVWAFRDKLVLHKLAEPLFARLTQALADLGLVLNSGQIIDATFVPVPISRNTSEENKAIKENTVPEDWKETPARLAQKDTDARWTKKGGVAHYGYKNHINIDKDTKLITKSACTDASVHDSQELQTLVRSPKDGGETLWADSAYRSTEEEAALIKSQHKSQICERAYRNSPLTDAQKKSNTQKSRIRARVEHVFGAMENEMGGIFLRSIGKARAATGIMLMNLTYNLKRIETLIRLKVFSLSRIVAPVTPKNA